MKAIDALLNKITMYRLVLYELIFLLIAATVLAFTGDISYSPVLIVFSAAYMFILAWLLNKAFAMIFNAPSNPESTYITAFILALIITPASSFFDTPFFLQAGWAALIASASKYILAIGKKHMFNPAAVGVAAVAFILGESASWWVSAAPMLPFVALGGFLVVRKMRRFDLVLPFWAAALAAVFAFATGQGGDGWAAIKDALLYSPLIFFSTVMLTEPFTTPPRRPLRLVYGTIVGLLFPPFVHFGGMYLTPELALLLGNAFAYLVSPKQKLILTLKEKRRLTHDVYEFVLLPDKKPYFRPGEYMEWTLWHLCSDTRGIRRFFTIASSPTEHEVRLGVKFSADDSSSFKKKFVEMQEGETIVASERAGDFTLPGNKDKKLVFIAGGIGITPFRSMVRYLLDRGEKRPIVLLYSNRTPADVVYKDLFDEAGQKLGLKTLYAFTDKNAPLPAGSVDHIDAGTILREIPDFRERTFYLSGPHGMVVAFEAVLEGMGVNPVQIRKDFFPGFA